MCVNGGIPSLPPHDVLFPLIFHRLSPQDWFNLRAVDQTHHQLVSQFLQINRVLNLGYNKKLTQQAFKLLTTGAHCLRELNLAGLKFLTDDLLREVIINNPHLVSLELSECHHLTSGILQTVTVRSLQLKRLILRDCHWVTRESIEYHAFHQGFSQGQEHIIGLNLNGSRVGRVSSTPTKNQETGKHKFCLTEVDLTGCWELDDNVLVNFLSKFPRLSVVRLGNIYSLTDLALRALATYTLDLKILDIAGCWRVSDQGIRQMAEYCKKMSNLSVNDCRDVTEQSLSRLRQQGVVIDRKLDPIMVRLQRIRNEQRQARLQI
eukprot:GFUD01018032.1.p1 GENE.GFUD01018032.1~~GFUD01018032.1.p1  ORF type:complete len:320 (+),score=58.90 GFUD01018032.1:68-1027(+)